MVEHRSPKPGVAGSSPATPAKFFGHFQSTGTGTGGVSPKSLQLAANPWSFWYLTSEINLGRFRFRGELARFSFSEAGGERKTKEATTLAARRA